jgi:hypothetical protein
MPAGDVKSIGEPRFFPAKYSRYGEFEEVLDLCGFALLHRTASTGLGSRS